MPAPLGIFLLLVALCYGGRLCTKNNTMGSSVTCIKGGGKTHIHCFHYFLHWVASKPIRVQNQVLSNLLFKILIVKKSFCCCWPFLGPCLQTSGHSDKSIFAYNGFSAFNQNIHLQGKSSKYDSATRTQFGLLCGRRFTHMIL